MRLGRQTRRLEAAGRAFDLGRAANGVVTIAAADDLAFAAALGFAHALDRPLQLLLVRAIGQGRLAELVDDTDEALAVDLFFRHLGFAAGARAEAARLAGAAPAAAEACRCYAAGVNEGLRRGGLPWELRLVGFRAEGWEPADTLLTLKLMSFVGLAQTQLDAETLIVQAVKEGVALGKLRALFAPHLDSLTEERAALLRSVRLEKPFLPGGVRFDGLLAGPGTALPSLHASNNVAVAAARSATGGALAASDPHLEVNRLPAVWAEVAARVGGEPRIGVTVPGVPGLVMGRTGRIAATFTYGFMDQADLFVEEVRGGACRRGDGWEPLAARRETILRKKHPPLALSAFETDAGTLETPLRADPPPDGLHLARAFALDGRGGAETLTALLALWRAGDVPGAQRALHDCAVSANWLLADSGGRIGYQQTGLLPRRASADLAPLPAWEPRSRWDGFVPGGELASVLDPPDGLLVTANDAWNPPGGPAAVTLDMGDDRASRIRALLAGKAKVSPDDLKGVQRDLVSRQAQRLRPLFAPHVPAGPLRDLLLSWDLSYDAASRGAVLFERIWAAVLAEVFGARTFGADAWRTLVERTSLVGYYFRRLDDVLADGDEELWFGPEGRTALLARVVPGALEGLDAASVPTWGETRRVVMANLLLGGKLPRFLGFDREIVLVGSRATVVQGQVLSAGGRTTTFAPSWRMVADLSRDDAETVLAGGPSDRRFSGWYATDLARWLGFAYKTVRPPA